MRLCFAAPAGSVMIYNAHAWHGGTRNREGSRRRVLHGLYIDRADTPQQDQAALAHAGDGKPPDAGAKVAAGCRIRPVAGQEVLA